jgi:hypothetical protein
LRPEEFEAAIARLPVWILGLAVAGTLIAGSFRGLSEAGGFLLGALAAYLNFRLIERAANRIAGKKARKPRRGTGAWVFIQFAGVVGGAFVIIEYSGFNLTAAFFGFLVCPAAVVLEIVYELLKYDHHS